MTDVTRWILRGMRSLAALGLRHACVCPGSRSAPIVLALQAAPEIRTTVHHDERAAGFFALGLARETGRPVAIVCTSGSAVAHLLPAVVEASAADVPLLILSADRPPELHGCGAPQTMPQQHLFGPHVRAFHDPGPPWAPGERTRTPGPTPLDHIGAVFARAWHDALERGRPGPVHVNLPFREPLEPSAPPESFPLAPDPFPVVRRLPLAAPRLAPEAEASLAAWWARARRPVVLAGPEACSTPADSGALRRLATEGGAVLLADALSGLRTAVPRHRPRAASTPDILLTRDPELEADALVLVGRPPTSRLALQWRAGLGAIPVLALDPLDRWDDPLRRPGTRAPIPAEAFTFLLERRGMLQPAEGHSPAAARDDNAAIDALLEAERLPLSAAVARLLVRALRDGDRLHVASSMPVRDVDAFGGFTTADARITANRGVNGIDGTLSSALGARAGRPPGDGRIFVYLGDVAALHDLTALLAIPEAPGPVTVVVLNNDGGGIFEHLPTARFSAHSRFFVTPHGRSIADLAAPFGVPVRRVGTIATLREAIDADRERTEGVAVIEVVADRVAERQTRWDALVALGRP